MRHFSVLLLTDEFSLRRIFQEVGWDRRSLCRTFGRWEETGESSSSSVTLWNWVHTHQNPSIRRGSFISLEDKLLKSCVRNSGGSGSWAVWQAPGMMGWWDDGRAPQGGALGKADYSLSHLPALVIMTVWGAPPNQVNRGLGKIIFGGRRESWRKHRHFCAFHGNVTVVPNLPIG